MDSEIAYSRVQKTADQLGELATDRHRFLDKRVLVTGEPEVLSSPNGRECLLNSIRLVVRICPNIVVSLPSQSGDLARQALDLAGLISFGKPVEFLPEVKHFDDFDAILSVGTKAKPHLPWTAINSNGFVARVTSGDVDISSDCRRSNPIGALGAASLGAGELFKRLLRVKPERCELLNGFTFCFRSYSSTTSDYGPEIPPSIPHDLLVVGAGAIGNGIVHLISRLPFRGRVSIVDRQQYGTENLGTCLLLSPNDLNKSKAIVLAANLVNAGIDAIGFPQSFQDYAKNLQEYPAVVLNALDNIDARHEVQRTLWPDIVVDGAIGDFACQVSRHPWATQNACLMCLFQRPAGRSAEDLQSEATGLSKNRLQNSDSLLTESDLECAAIEKQAFLRSRLGRTVCSIVQESIAQMLSEEEQTRGFQPSVPFVACFSACMVLSETLAHLCDWESRLETRFQFDFLMGPAHGQELPQTRRENCICGRRKNVNNVRTSHGLQSYRVATAHSHSDAHSD